MGFFGLCFLSGLFAVPYGPEDDFRILLCRILGPPVGSYIGGRLIPKRRAIRNPDLIHQYTPTGSRCAKLIFGLVLLACGVDAVLHVGESYAFVLVIFASTLVAALNIAERSAR